MTWRENCIDGSGLCLESQNMLGDHARGYNIEHAD